MIDYKKGVLKTILSWWPDLDALMVTQQPPRCRYFDVSDVYLDAEKTVNRFKDIQLS